jgi:hypothetical protein
MLGTFGPRYRTNGLDDEEQLNTFIDSGVESDLHRILYESGKVGDLTLGQRNP